MEPIEQLYHRLLHRVGERKAWRRAVLFCSVMVRETRRDALVVRAATLSYWTLITIVPVLVLAAAVLTPLTPVGAEPFHKLALQTLLAAPVRGVGETVDQWLSTVDLGKLGVIGIIGVLFTSSRIYFSIEEAYNTLWNTRPKRSWLIRLVLFYTTITLGPLLITAGFQLSDSFEARVGFNELHFLLPAALTALAFVSFIRVLPDTNVRWGPALIGGLSSALVFEIAKQSFGLYTRLLGAEDKAAKIYGSLWLFPVFLVWLNFLWIVVLLGVELAYVVQRRDELIAAEERRLGGDAEARRHADALFALQCLVIVAQRYATGRGPTPEPLVTRALSTDPTFVRNALETLEDVGILAEAPNGYLPALPLDRLTVREVLVRYRERTRPSTGRGAPGGLEVERLLHEGLGGLDTPISTFTAVDAS